MPVEVSYPSIEDREWYRAQIVNDYPSGECVYCECVTSRHNGSVFKCYVCAAESIPKKVEEM